MDFPLEMFNKTHYKVVRSHEEKQQALKEGWSAERPSDHPYLPISAGATVPPPNPPSAPSPEAAEPVKRGPGRPPIVRDKPE